MLFTAHVIFEEIVEGATEPVGRVGGPDGLGAIYTLAAPPTVFHHVLARLEELQEVCETPVIRLQDQLQRFDLLVLPCRVRERYVVAVSTSNFPIPESISTNQLHFSSYVL